ncbi:hypothetical protein IOD16_24055 [Saccharothrix sp. 6-C]|uniref:hypothetical protein n=1 Tax=Saccharothrix sp. 6-C TaxID=2781735 RepID=UPI00191779C1|nr:hypothetical protein [Saccharothrix sp. 6-C]QQQ74262.1 hypothetical protein IOD16_24055 [Saccharothrix sp. 6-C]
MPACRRTLSSASRVASANTAATSDGSAARARPRFPRGDVTGAPAGNGHPGKGFQPAA